MDSVTLKSGRSLEVKIAPFAVANKLRKVLAGELLKVDVQFERLNLSLDLDLAKLDPKLANTLKNLVLTLISSEAVEAAFFECAVRSTIDGAKITRESFEAPETRGDLLPVAWEVIRANVAPFFAGLDLSSLTSAKGMSGAQP